MDVDDQRLTAVRRGALARTRTWNHRLGGGSYILFNYKGSAAGLCQNIGQ